MKGRLHMKRTLVFTLFICLFISLVAFPMMAMAEGATPAAPAIDLTPVFQALIALLAALITAKVIPWIKSKISKDQQLAMMATVKILVFAAEQIYGAGQGDKKLAWVEATLQAQGYSLNTELIKETIEAQVQELTLAQTGGDTTATTA